MKFYEQKWSTDNNKIKKRQKFVKWWNQMVQGAGTSGQCTQGLYGAWSFLAFLCELLLTVYFII